VAVIRVSGAKAGDVIDKLAGSRPVPRRAMLRRIVAGGGELIDRGLVLWFPAPTSFTGEDVAEFHVHGGPAVVEALLNALSEEPQLRAAEPGEFTRRAYAQGKFDLTEVEGLADLIEADTERQRRQAIRQAEGGSRRLLGRWREKLIGILARLEAAIDFVDEAHVSESALADTDAAVRTLALEIAREVQRGKQGRRLREGLRVVLAGPPNVGKSSLMNRLTREDRVIVSPVPGTTRDVVEAHIDIEGLPVILQDTAGLRGETQDAIESEGMARASSALGRADLVLWIRAPDVEDSEEVLPFDSDVLRIWNKADLGAPPAAEGGSWPYYAISAKTGEGIRELEAAMAQRLDMLVKDGESALVTRQRHREGLSAMLQHLNAALTAGQPLEITAEEIRLAVHEIGRLTGHVEVESLLDKIFKEFCIGK
jgi:tRNA modification GTPase